MSVTYTATLSVREETVFFLSGLLNAERQRRGTRAETRALGCFKQAILVIRWFLDGTRVKQLAVAAETRPAAGGEAQTAARGRGCGRTPPDEAPRTCKRDVAGSIPAGG